MLVVLAGSIMNIDPRDAIWNETYALLYNTSYSEELELALLGRWTWLDSISKIAVAVASAGSALAGLVFWENSNYTFLWPLFTSASALLAIISKQLSVGEKLKIHAKAVTELSGLMIDINALIIRMKINAEFSISDFEKKLLVLHGRYRIETGESPYDFLLTARLRAKIQRKIDAIFAG
jgi:hypothetical protein